MAHAPRMMSGLSPVNIVRLAQFGSLMRWLLREWWRGLGCPLLRIPQAGGWAKRWGRGRGQPEVAGCGILYRQHWHRKRKQRCLDSPALKQSACLRGSLAHARVDGVLGHEGPADLACAVFERGMGGGADGGLVRDVEVGEPVECGVVGVEGLVGGCGVEGGRGWFGAGNGRVCLHIVHSLLLACV